MSKLFLIPIDFKYGGGYSALIKAETLEEAQTRAKGFNDRFFWAKSHPLSNELEIGSIEDFDYVLINYYE